MWYQVDRSRKYWHFKRQKCSYMWALCSEKCEHSPIVGLFCIHSSKAKIQPDPQPVPHLMWNKATLCDDEGVTSSSTTMIHPRITDEHFEEGILMLSIKMFCDNQQSSYSTMLTENWAEFYKVSWWAQLGSNNKHRNSYGLFRLLI